MALGRLVLFTVALILPHISEEYYYYDQPQDYYYYYRSFSPRHYYWDKYGPFYYDVEGYKHYVNPYVDWRYTDPVRFHNRYYDKPLSRASDVHSTSNELLPSRVRLGEGQYRLVGRDAELNCEFPGGGDIISNVVWDRMKDRYYNYNNIYSYYRDRIRVSPHSRGSILLLRDVGPEDKGTYRCLATRKSRAHYPESQTVFQDIHFFPSAL